MRVAVCVPARMNSKRFPGKPLAKILGKEMILHVLEKCEEAVLVFKSDIYAVIDEDENLKKLIKNDGFNAICIKEAKTGTDRICKAMHKINANIIVNVQGDEPLINPFDIDKVIIAKTKNINKVIGTMRKLQDGEMENKNVVKVELIQNQLIGMTREKTYTHMRQTGIYAYTKQELRNFEKVKSINEDKENIELLRFLEMGKEVYMQEITGCSHAVDIPDDIKIIESAMCGANEPHGAKEDTNERLIKY